MDKECEHEFSNLIFSLFYCHKCDKFEERPEEFNYEHLEQYIEQKKEHIKNGEQGIYTFKDKK